MPTPNCPDRQSPTFAPPPWGPDHPEYRRLDDRLPPDHLARRIDHLVSLLDLAPLHACYAGSGSVPHRPDLMLKVVLYEYHLGFSSPADWHAHVRENEPVQWLAQGLRPARSRCYAFRDRLNLCLDDLNQQIRQHAFDLGLSTGQRGVQDGTTAAANASRRRLDNVKTLPAKVHLLHQACAADEQGQPLLSRPGWMAPTRRGRQRQLRRLEKAEEVLRQRLAENRQRRACDRLQPEEVRVSTADPEAVLGQDKEGVYRPLYNIQFLRDLDSPLILGHMVGQGVSDAGTLKPVVGGYQQEFGRRLTDLLADTSYSSGPQLQAAQEAGVRLYAPLPKEAKSKQLPKQQFTFQAEQDVYVCPQGKVLSAAGRRTQVRAEGERVQLQMYRSAESDCRDCPVRGKCLGGQAATRTIHRSEHEERVEQLRARMASAEAKELYKKRKETVELSFADVKEHRDLRRFSGKGRRRVQTEVGLHVLVHNGLYVERAVRQAQQAAQPADNST
jgi:radical SAM protein with 4Fe4S-binding SPASM domain